jgi:hypothetical protein
MTKNKPHLTTIPHLVKEWVYEKNDRDINTITTGAAYRPT